jgi:hypothetical protein
LLTPYDTTKILCGFEVPDEPPER